MDARESSDRIDAVISITGHFDRIAASRCRASLADLPPSACVLLDFSRASQVADLALDVLTAALSTPGQPRVVLRGLTQHHERMLRYLGRGGFLCRAGGEDSPE